jgi:uncharacterized Fe-S cluster-containing protein
MTDISNIQLPGLNCGLCGYPTCDEFRLTLDSAPEMLQRCIHLSKNRVDSASQKATKPQELKRSTVSATIGGCGATAMGGRENMLLVRSDGGNGNISSTCGECTADERSVTCATQSCSPRGKKPGPQRLPWRDHLDREFDFYLEHFPEEAGPREIIIPHNPMLTREMDVQKGDILIGRPLGMSCGCPITHCGVVTEVDHRTGVIVWCVTGPLGPRQKGFKDLGYYIAEAYEGLVHEARCELKLGMRYFFQPRMCMLQWRHSGLINYVSRNKDGYQIRIEGLWIG